AEPKQEAYPYGAVVRLHGHQQEEVDMTTLDTRDVVAVYRIPAVGYRELVSMIESGLLYRNHLYGGEPKTKPDLFFAAVSDTSAKYVWAAVTHSRLRSMSDSEHALWADAYLNAADAACEVVVAFRPDVAGRRVTTFVGA